VIHGSSRSACFAFRDLYRAFAAAYALARERLRGGAEDRRVPRRVLPVAVAVRERIAGLSRPTGHHESSSECPSSSLPMTAAG
jgi:hypothetical protein